MLIGHSSQAELLTALAKKDRLHHGYIFHGIPGIGKGAFAKEFASFLELGAWEGGSILQDALVISPVEGTIGIDAVRAVRDFLFQKPVFSPYRTVIVHDAESLTQEAQNALLKISEEPPPHALLVLTLRDPSLLLETLVSRLHLIYFSPPGETATATWLHKEKGIAKEKATALAKQSFGRPGLALRMQDDEELKNYTARAKKFLSVSEGGLKDLLKQFTADESFRLEPLLDALLLVAAEHPERHGGAWHRMVELRARAHEFALNPKIQLTYAWNLFSKN